MSINNNLVFFIPDPDSHFRIPMSENAVPAGFPSPALDFMEERIDLNKALSENPLATFFIRVEGDSMTDAGICDKDVLVVDRSIEPKDGKIAICFIDGGFTVKRLKIEKESIWLMPENSKYKPIKVDVENEFTIWGIVTYVIKKV
ncbi:MAG TPA: translesion error-prone DNA polymerase V autoproteolytic subunit [Flavobacterium sp.]